MSLNYFTNGTLTERECAHTLRPADCLCALVLPMLGSSWHANVMPEAPTGASCSCIILLCRSGSNAILVIGLCAEGPLHSMHWHACMFDNDAIRCSSS